MPYVKLKSSNGKTVLTFGNMKLPDSTAIFNLCSAANCSSRKLGFCQAFVNGKCICYALAAERQYPKCRPYRNRQEKYFDSVTAETFARELLEVVGRKRKPVTALRVNEAGDFRSQADIDKVDTIARIIKPKKIRTYCYTARQDLDFTNLSTLVVNGSGFQKPGIKGQFKMIGKTDKVPKGFGVCPGSCVKCIRCIKGLKTIVREH